ncbi:YihY/virulence factor BrkB family protein [Niabella insulamsoli]|uniref:YihY/virulence factor BrkB family protein n=1 Tax=Niabella insulamsoli TaxID=3144874 RepID=UPI0031FBCC83
MKKVFNRPKTFFRQAKDILIASAKGFANDKVPKLSSSLAYCTVFSMAPLLTIVIASASLIYKKEIIEGKIYDTVINFTDSATALQIQNMVTEASLSGKTTMALIIGIISLIIGATAVFLEIQDSLNTIWKVKAKPRKGIMGLLTNRLKSFSLIISLGFLLLVSLILNSILGSVQTRLQDLVPVESGWLFIILNNVLTFSVITFLFAIIFKVLPDVIIKWKPAFVGAAFTTVLFGIGKLLIDLYITKASPGAIFGAAGTIIIVLLWVYYTSFILYFGAEFTQVYAEKYSVGIKPSKYAVHMEIIVDEKQVSELPPQHPEYTKE